MEGMHNTPANSSPDSATARPELFSAGSIVVSDQVRAALSEEEIQTLIQRHTHGDWNEDFYEDGDPPEAMENRYALSHGYHILSQYIVRGRKVFLHTPGHRGLTRIMFSDEY